MGTPSTIGNPEGLHQPGRDDLQPGDLGDGTYRLGLLSGALIHTDGKNTRISPSLKEGLDIDGICGTEAALGIRDKVMATIEGKRALFPDGSWKSFFVEAFMKAVKAEATQPGVSEIVRAGKKLEETAGIPHPMGIGIIGIDSLNS